MKRIFIDSNVFLVYFTNDDPSQHAQAKALFEKAAGGKLGLVTGPPVVFEIGWVLRKVYKLSREAVLAVLEALLATPGLVLFDEPKVAAAILLARHSNQEFADAYIAATMQAEQIDEIATFNKKHFERLKLKTFAFK